MPTCAIGYIFHVNCSNKPCTISVAVCHFSLNAKCCSALVDDAIILL